ncbi:MAG: hypothetical protein ACLVJ6_06220 [Merdibacter sp.]
MAAFFDLKPENCQDAGLPCGWQTYAFLLRGDRELNETKVLKLLGANEIDLRILRRSSA